MAYQLPAYLHRNRYGVLYFRLAVPTDVQKMFGQREIYRSLSTSSVREAAEAALALRGLFRALFLALRTRDMTEEEKTLQDASKARLRTLLRHEKEKIALRARIDELVDETFALQIVNCRADSQHQRELDIALRLKGGEGGNPIGKLFAEGLEEYLADPARKPNTRKTYRGRLAHAQAFFGADKDLRYIEQSDLTEYMIHASKTRDNPVTVGHHITTLCGLLNWFRIRKGWGAQLTTKTLIPKSLMPATDERHGFTLEQLSTVFKNARSFKENQPYKYWATLAIAFTGCRIEELAQLNINTDLHCITTSGVWFIDINAKPDPDGVVRKSLKNYGSWRSIPIHSGLVSHGFIDYLMEQKNNGFDRPFESGWKPRHYDGGKGITWSHYIVNWGGRELNKLVESEGISNPGGKLSYFHSMRHTFSQCMRRAKVLPEICEATLGHAYAPIERERYDKLKSDSSYLSIAGIEPGLSALVGLI